MQQLSAVSDRVGRAVVPYVISSALGGGKNTSIRASAFSRAAVRGVYAPPQVFVDVIASKASDGSLVMQYHHHKAAFPDGMHGKPPSMLFTRALHGSLRRLFAASQAS